MERHRLSAVPLNNGTWDAQAEKEAKRQEELRKAEELRLEREERERKAEEQRIREVRCSRHKLNTTSDLIALYTGTRNA